jgi:hypothetical protein
MNAKYKDFKKRLSIYLSLEVSMSRNSIVGARAFLLGA